MDSTARSFSVHHFIVAPTSFRTIAKEPKTIARIRRGRRPQDDAGDRSQPTTPHRASRKGQMFDRENRRKGRPAVTRNPYDTPLRDGNRDRLMGLLTKCAVRTLTYYLSETNVTVCHWLNRFSMDHPIPKTGTWEDVCGETFIRKLLTLPTEDASLGLARDELFDCSRGIDVDPRNLAQRIMEIRSHLAREFIQDLQAVHEENSSLLKETLTLSLLNSVDESYDES